MYVKIIDGRALATDINFKTKQLIQANNLNPKLGIILASDDKASKTYVNLKKKKANQLGIDVEIFEFKANSKIKDIVFQINDLNHDTSFNGVLIQVPFFPHLRNQSSLIINSLHFNKDVDGLTATQQGLVSQLMPQSILPAAVEAILESLNLIIDEEITWKSILSSQKEITYFKGKHIIILNNSDLVGKPLAQVLATLGATVTISNEFTHNLKVLLSLADIVISATGKTGLINAEMIKEDTILIDVTSEKIDGVIKGDFVRSDELDKKAYAITPVPGGVGPITIACLLRTVVTNLIR